jgi:hypothetical protein
MIDEVKSESEKDHKIIHERIDKIEQNISALSKFKWQAGAAAAVLALLVGAGSRIIPFFLTPPTQPVIIENQK